MKNTVVQQCFSNKIEKKKFITKSTYPLIFLKSCCLCKCVFPLIIEELIYTLLPTHLQQSVYAQILIPLLIQLFYSPTFRLKVTGTNLRTEPKHIVFLTQLLLLFRFCHTCKTDNPALEARQVGTKAVITTTCSNPKCPKQVQTWHTCSQPDMPNSCIAAGNFLLCMAILLAGGSVTKVSHIFTHMGLGCVSLNTFFKYQRVSYLIHSGHQVVKGFLHEVIHHFSFPKTLCSGNYEMCATTW